MQTELETSASEAVDLAREGLYRFLAAALTDPREEGTQLLFELASQRLACEAAELIRAEALARSGTLGFGELPPEELSTLALCNHLRGDPDDLRREYDRVFGLTPPRECPPFETEYHPSEPFFRSQQMADIAGFYRAFGLEPATSTRGRPDYLVLELEYMALVLMKKRLALVDAAVDPDAAEHVQVCDEAQRNFFRDHLAWWVPSFATGLRRRAGTGFYAALAEVLAAFVAAERRWLDVPAPKKAVEVEMMERPEEPDSCAGCNRGQ